LVEPHQKAAKTTATETRTRFPPAREWRKFEAAWNAKATWKPAS